MSRVAERGRRVARSLSFARHIPPAKIVRRLMLAARRRIERALHREAAAAPASLSEHAPLPLFPPRPPRAWQERAGWRFTFVGRTEACADRIDWCLGGAGPANQLWRMNLHYFEWGDTIDDAAFERAATDWVAANRPLAPGAEQDSWNSYALSLRVVEWLQQSSARRERLDPATIDAIVGSCARQLRFLETHLESDLGGNHLLKNIVALLWGSAALTSTDAPLWRTLGLRLLRGELGQFLPDGMHFERSSSYHAQALGDLLTIRHALGHDPFAGALDATIEHAGQVLADLTHPDGGTSLFGDSGLSMARPTAELLGAATTLLGHDGEPRAAFDLCHAGYAGLRHERDLLLVDAGALEPGSLPAHVHGDMGSFEWSVAGQRIVVDQGVFTYVAGEERDQSRSARYHNTLAAPGADQGDFFGAFRLGARCRLVERRVEAAAGSLNVTVAHSGLVGPDGGARHRRQIHASRDRIEIVDALDRRVQDAAVTFLLAPDVEAVLDGGTVRLTTAGATVRIVSDGALSIEDACWWPDLGTTNPTKRIRVAVTGLACHTSLVVEARNEP